jgi:hypothetical protein
VKSRDALIQEIRTLRVLFAAALVSEILLFFGYLHNASSITRGMAVAMVAAGVVLLVAGIWIHKSAFARMNQLRL